MNLLVQIFFLLAMSPSRIKLVCEHYDSVISNRLVCSFSAWSFLSARPFARLRGDSFAKRAGARCLGFGGTGFSARHIDDLVYLEYG
jgi:hypothetical protein